MTKPSVEYVGNGRDLYLELSKIDFNKDHVMLVVPCSARPDISCENREIKNHTLFGRLMNFENEQGGKFNLENVANLSFLTPQVKDRLEVFIKDISEAYVVRDK